VQEKSFTSIHDALNDPQVGVVCRPIAQRLAGVALRTGAKFTLLKPASAESGEMTLTPGSVAK
jgi:hypothetical protein